MQVLEAVRKHPLMSCEQLQLYLGLRKRTLQWHLEKLVNAKLVRVINGHQPNSAMHSLYVPTRAGLERLASEAGMSLETYLEVYKYHAAHLEHLVLVLDRAYEVRSFFLQLKNADWSWSLAEWDVEVQINLQTYEYDLPIPLQGIARLKDAQGRWITIFVEYDMNITPVRCQRARLASIVEGSYDDRFTNLDQSPPPVLVILAASRDRLHEYRLLIHELACVRYPVPHTFFTNQAWWHTYHQDPNAQVWKIEEWNDVWYSLLSHIQGGTHHPADYLRWAPLPPLRRFSERAVELESIAIGTSIAHKRHDVAALTLILHTLDKELLALIGDHPLLDAVEMAQVKQMPVRSIRRRLKHLVKWELVEARKRPWRLEKKTNYASRAERQRAKAHCYILTEKGLWLLTAWAGYGKAIESYARLRGWKKRFWELVYHWDHTRLENTVYVQFLSEARRRGHQIPFWFSELESRMYFDTSYEFISGRKFSKSLRKRKRKSPFSKPTPYGNWGIEYEVGNRREFASLLGHHSSHDLKSFLPDSRGMYQDDKCAYTIMVEIDRTRANHNKLWQKIHYYLRTMDPKAQSSWRILVVTTGWQRAAHIADLVVQRALGYLARDLNRYRGESLIAKLKECQGLDAVLCSLLPVYVTTIRELCERGIASPIWLTAEDAMNGVLTERRCCLECFRPKME